MHVSVQTLEDAPGLQALSRLLASPFGTTTVVTYWFTFFPPNWYRERLTAIA